MIAFLVVLFSDSFSDFVILVCFMEGGIAHWKVSVGYGVVQLVVGLFAWFAVQRHLFFGIAGVGLLVIVFFFVNMKVKKPWRLGGFSEAGVRKKECLAQSRKGAEKS